MKGTKTASRSTSREAPQREAAQVPARRGNTGMTKYDFKGVGPGAGMEGADRESFAIPFLLILQKMSPQLDKRDPAYVKNSKEGDIFNTASQEVYDGEEGIIVLPVSFKRSFTAWVIREKGGGFKGEYVPSDPIIITTKPDEKKRNILPDGITQLVDTRLHGVILLNGDTPQPGLISMTSTQIKKSKRWMTSMQEVQQKDNMPTFAHSYRLTTVPESNDQGSWMGWKCDPAGDVEAQEHIDAAVSFYQALQSGSVRLKADSTLAPDAN
ncbi:MAG: hypothetical protein U1E51_16905 [Candidatus Binatia bacterium]|nr:hypothetical protein [Candidatus Binatia bacterium]